MQTVQNILYKADLTQSDQDYINTIKIQKDLKFKIELKKKDQKRDDELKKYKVY